MAIIQADPRFDLPQSRHFNDRAQPE